MKNLKLLQCVPCAEIPNCHNGLLANDIDTGIIYIITESRLIGYQSKEENVVVDISLAGHEIQGDIIGIQHLPELEAVCFATCTGDVILYNTSIKQIECVGSVESGLTCMAWSPDQEIVAFTTGEQKIIIMNKDFDPLSEMLIDTQETAGETHVDVGWGKKETQFHGSLGKEAAQYKDEVVKTDDSVKDDKLPRISWRGDGQFFVVSSFGSQGFRNFRVWSREGSLVSTGEVINGLQCCINWRPSGNLIASTQKLPGTHQVVFFEKNGLRHGEFPLRFREKDIEVVKIDWNIDSSVLALWVIEKENSVTRHYVQLWYCSNYHWFMKQELDFSLMVNDREINDFIWDCEFPLKLHILTKGGSYLSYLFCWEITQTRGHSVNNKCTVAMIDGAKLLSTAMSKVVIPPPMSAYCSQVTHCINQVSFQPVAQESLLILSDGSWVVLKNTETSEDNTKNTDETSVQKRVYFSSTKEIWSGPGCLQQVTWWKENEVIAIGISASNRRNVLCYIQLSESNESYEATLISMVPVQQDILCLFTNVDTGTLAIQSVDGTMFQYQQAIAESKLGEIVPWELKDGSRLVLPQPCLHMETAQVGQEEVVLGLTEHSRLYMNNKEIANNCSSFFIHDEYVILTTTSHTLRFISLLPENNGLTALLNGQLVEDNTRHVERGSKIVTVITQDSKLILQMPRGNLETIYPRVLILSYLKKCFDSQRYKEAFVCMRKHRINHNLVVDHNPKMFLENVDSFIRQVESVSYINLFLSDLKKEDVTSSLYSDYYRNMASCEHFSTSYKVDIVCDSIRTALENIDKNKYLLSILTTYVKKTTPELETALNVVKTLKDSEDVNKANEALNYLLFLVDVNKIYDVALGMYDFKLVVMVAEKSQKDPKEYLPFLNNLRKMEENYQKFTIDKYLKRYSKAIRHLSKCGAETFEECLSLIKEHRLYTEAMNLYLKDSKEHRKIVECYGEYLLCRKKYDEAGLVFCRCECYEQALDAFQRSGNWRRLFCVVIKLALPQERRLLLARNMADYLKAHSRHDEAAVVLLDYTDDYEEAIEILINGHLWNEALRLMYKYERTDIVETHLEPALIEAYEHVISLLEANREQFDAHKTRLKVVQEAKERRKNDMMDELNEEPLDDIFSDTSSMTGLSTITASSLSSKTSRASGRSAKNRKKAKRKKVSLKEGSQFEDFALMEALSEIILLIDKMQEEICELLKMLLYFGHDSNARKLQERFTDVLQFVQSAIPEIWPKKTSEETQLVYGPGLTTNKIIQATTVIQNNEVTTPDIPVAPLPPVLKKPVSWKLDQLK